MKKKSKVVQQTTASPKNQLVGGRNAGASGINWSNVGRKRKNTDDAVLALATTLKALREKKGISLSRLAKELQVAPATLIKFEDRGHPISLAVVTAIADQLGCTLKVVEAAPAATGKR